MFLKDWIKKLNTKKKYERVKKITLCKYAVTTFGLFSKCKNWQPTFFREINCSRYTHAKKEAMGF